jgi:RNA polymerase I-specific transcription initiation factor RRN3
MPGLPYTQLPTPINPPQTTSLPTTSPKETCKREDIRTQFHSLLSIFDRTILRTFKSRYTQFLVFWYASLDPEFADTFQGMLVDRAIMPSTVGGPTVQSTPFNADGENNQDEHITTHMHAMTPELTRAAAASYIGSFVSRATFVDREGARRVTAVLCEYLRTHLEGVEADLRASMAFGTGSGSMNISSNVAAAIGAILASGQHAVFYAVAQAVFLIFCFRWRDLVGGDDDDDDDELALDLDLDVGSRMGQVKIGPVSKDKWMPELAVLKRVVSSVLNPLKVCSTNVVMQFARVAQATDFVYCYTILESNKRADFSASLMSTSTSSPRRQSLSASTILMHTNVLYEPATAELNTFFPFDPCRLPKSSIFIQGVYREWSSVAIDDDDDDDDGDDDDDDEEDEELLKNDADSSEGCGIGASSGYLNIPRDKTAAVGRRSKGDGGLGESLGAMSISPA